MPLFEDYERLITGSAILSYHTCVLQAWLTMRRFLPEQENPFLVIGRFVHENSYQEKGEKEIELPGAKIDVIWKEGAVTIVGEIKKSSRSFQGAKLQLLFYLKLLSERGISAVGRIMVPLEKKVLNIEWNVENREELNSVMNRLKKLADNEAPIPEWKSVCMKCGFCDFCWS
jgi:CRISPR-associated exonuclease Cas4